MSARANATTRRVARQYGFKETPDAKEKFVKALREGATVGEACKESNIGYRTSWDWREKDPEFAAAWAAAVEEGVDLLEAEARRRARDGTVKTIYNKDGQVVAEERVYSDPLMTLLLKGRRKQVFSERVEQTGPDGGPVQHKIEVTFVKAKGVK